MNEILIFLLVVVAVVIFTNPEEDIRFEDIDKQNKDKV